MSTTSILGKVVVIHRGTYNPLTTYQQLDEVYLNENTYRVKFGASPPAGTPPTNTTYWTIVAQSPGAAANIAKDLAKLWANADEDYAIEPGLYSAKHWAAKAEEAGEGIIDTITAVGDAAEAAKDIAVAAKDTAVAAKDDAISAADASATSSGLSEDARALAAAQAVIAVAAASDASDAKDAAEAVVSSLMSTGMFWEFSSTTADADPGSGKFRFNNATIASATRIFINLTNGDLADATAWIAALDDSTTSNSRGELTLRDSLDPETYAVFRITNDNVTATGYRKLVVTYLTGNGTFTDTSNFFFVFRATGDAGESGTGVGDMIIATYDPNGVDDDAFNMDNMLEGTDNKILTASERAAIADAFLKTTNTTDNITEGSTKKFTTAARNTKVDYLTVTGNVNLDALNTRVASLDAAVVLRGSWDASGGTFPGGGTAQAGDSYIVSVGGTVNSVQFVAGDRIIAILDNASTTTYASNWLIADYSDKLGSIAGLTGNPDDAAVRAAIHVADYSDNTEYQIGTSAILHNLTAKASPIFADEVTVGDSADSFKGKRSTLTQIKTLMTSAGWDVTGKLSSTSLGVNIGSDTPAGAIEVSYSTASGGSPIFERVANETGGSGWISRKARGTRASKTAITTGDTVMSFTAQAYDGSNYIAAGNLRWVSRGTIATNDIETNCEILVSDGGVNTVAARFDYNLTANFFGPVYSPTLNVLPAASANANVVLNNSSSVAKAYVTWDWDDDILYLSRADFTNALAQSSTGAWSMGGNTIWAANQVNSATAKTTPVDNDLFAIVDSAASNVLKKLSWTNVKATLKTYCDTLYAALGSQVVTAKTSDYTIALADVGTMLTMEHATLARTFTIPANGTIPFPVGSRIDFARLGAGVVNITGASSVQINAVTATAIPITAQYKAASIIKIATNQWLLFGAV